MDDDGLRPDLLRAAGAFLIEDDYARLLSHGRPLPRPLQEAAVELVSSPAWDRHLRALSSSLRERCSALADALARDLPGRRLARRPSAGLHLWAELAEAVRRLARLG
ncbi:hypothetical protein [Nonomuraea rubra]|uniref:DNA-binding transcriptional MocR family regulator n=1 Tax=Nonomuraea rubra TaxID=46180 RepID=A0A7X0TX95_9ACTN|nr:DNA-binding transcriptional MocR family regulator [Nonomuraea rubra]